MRTASIGLILLVIVAVVFFVLRNGSGEDPSVAAKAILATSFSAQDAFMVEGGTAPTRWTAAELDGQVQSLRAASGALAPYLASEDTAIKAAAAGYQRSYALQEQAIVTFRAQVASNPERQLNTAPGPRAVMAQHDQALIAMRDALDVMLKAGYVGPGTGIPTFLTEALDAEARTAAPNR